MSRYLVSTTIAVFDPSFASWRIVDRPPAPGIARSRIRRSGVSARTLATALSESLREIYNSTIPLDDHTKARGFAQALLSVIQHALSIELLRTHLKFDAARLQLVLSDIANSAY